MFVKRWEVIMSDLVNINNAKNTIRILLPLIDEAEENLKVHATGDF